MAAIQGSPHGERYRIWLEDLESIRRPQPVLSTDSTGYIVTEVAVAAPPPQSQGADGATGGNTTAAGRTRANPVVLEDDDGDAHDNGSHAPRDWRVFYGVQGGTPAEAQGAVRYQDQRLMTRNLYPSRQNGLGFDMARLRRDTNWVDPIQSTRDAQPAWDHAMFMSEPPLGFDRAVTSNWLRDVDLRPLLRGFPMVRNVVFYRPSNHDGARSTCFFKALSYLMYGSHSFYRRVQAEHWQHYSDILDWDDHPRHRLYQRMNQRFYDTIISAGDREVSTAANFFQLLSIPNIWMPLDSKQLSHTVLTLTRCMMCLWPVPLPNYYKDYVRL